MVLTWWDCPCTKPLGCLGRTVLEVGIRRPHTHFGRIPRSGGVYLEPIKIYNFPPSLRRFSTFYARPAAPPLLPAGILKSIFIVLLFLGGPFSFRAERRFSFSLADGNIMRQQRLHCFPQLIGAGCSWSVREGGNSIGQRVPNLKY